MSDTRRPVFLERDLYRRRRVIDAAKLLPICGIVLFLFPVLTLDDRQPDQIATASRLIYFFSVWFFLIAVAFVLSRWVRPEVNDPPSETDRDADQTDPVG